MLVVLGKSRSQIIRSDPGTIDAELINAARCREERGGFDGLALQLEIAAQDRHPTVGRLAKNLHAGRRGRHSFVPVQQGIGLPDFPDLQVADPGGLAFLDQPAYVIELGIGDIVAAVTQRTDVHPAQQGAAQQDAELTVRDGNRKPGGTVRQQAVRHRKALEHLSGHVLLRISGPVHIDLAARTVQFYADERLIGTVFHAHDVQVGIHQSRIVSA